MRAGTVIEFYPPAEEKESQGHKGFLSTREEIPNGALANEREYRNCLIQTVPILCFQFGALAGMCFSSPKPFRRLRMHTLMTSRMDMLLGPEGVGTGLRELSNVCTVGGQTVSKTCPISTLSCPMWSVEVQEPLETVANILPQAT